jgi:hypothetical protein
MTPGLEQSLWSWPEARLEVGSAHELCQEGHGVAVTAICLSILLVKSLQRLYIPRILVFIIDCILYQGVYRWSVYIYIYILPQIAPQVGPNYIDTHVKVYIVGRIRCSITATLMCILLRCTLLVLESQRCILSARVLAAQIPSSCDLMQNLNLTKSDLESM